MTDSKAPTVAGGAAFLCGIAAAAVAAAEAAASFTFEALPYEGLSLSEFDTTVRLRARWLRDRTKTPHGEGVYRRSSS